MNVRYLSPRVQRAVEGVVQEKWELDDDQIKDLVADALAEIVLYTGSVFGSQLLVLETDPVTGAPVEYGTDEPLSLPQAAVVAAQAALTYFYHRFAGMKVSEQISDEASHWEYQLSPSLLVAQMNLLKDTRDRALEAVSAQNGGLESYVSLLAARDNSTARYIEPWVYGIQDGYGIGAGGLEGDFRFGIGGGDFAGLLGGGGMYPGP